MPMGSHGDVLPLLGLARELQASSNWKVKALISPVFAKAAQAAGVDFRPISTVEQYDRAQNDPDHDDRFKQFAIFRMVLLPLSSFAWHLAAALCTISTLPDMLSSL